MKVLYHFLNSPFSRRVRLALAHKGIEVELVEARENPQQHAELKTRAAYVTVPVLVEDDGRALGESGSIVNYLDAAYPERPRLWPQGSDAILAFEVQALVDAALDSLVSSGNRFFKLSGDPAWKDVRAFEVDRVERAFAVLAERVGALGRPTVAASGWSAADIWLYTMVHWLEIMPPRAANHHVSRQILSLGWTLPPALVDWARQHDARTDVRALGGL